MYAQWHAVPWTQEYDQGVNYMSTLMHCFVERYKSNEFIEIYRVWHEKVKFPT